MKCRQILVYMILCVLCGCHKKVTTFTASFNRPCMDYFLDVKVVSFKQSGLFNNMGFDFEVGPGTVGMNDLRVYNLGLQMLVRNPQNGVRWVAEGQGTVRNVTWSFGAMLPKTDVPFVLQRGSDDLDSLSTLTKRAVRNTLEQLKENMKDEIEPQRQTIDSILVDGKITVANQKPHRFQEGDLFYVYAQNQGQDSSCDRWQKLDSDLMATASLHEITDKEVILEVIKTHGDQRPLQRGDLVEAFSKSRSDEDQDDDNQIIKPLRWGNVLPPPPVIQIFFDHQIYTTDITGLIQTHILKESEDYGFQINF